MSGPGLGPEEGQRRGIRKGEPWEVAASGPPDVTIVGGDTELARSVGEPSEPAPLLHYTPVPPADLARSLGLGATGPAGDLALAVDAMLVEVDGRAEPVVNAVEVGVAPDRLGWWRRRHRISVTVDGSPLFVGRAFGVIVANGQFLRTADLVPRGHPGDGRVEVQVYAVRRGETRAVRDRLATGTHLPHPRIHERAGRTVEIECPKAVPLRADGTVRAPARRIRIEVLPGALRVLV